MAISTGVQGSNGVAVAPAAANKEAKVIQDLLKREFEDKFDSWGVLLEQWWTALQEVANFATTAKGPSGPSANAAAAAMEGRGLQLRLDNVSELVSTVHSSPGLNLLDYHTVSRGLSEVESWPEAVPPVSDMDPGMLSTTLALAGAANHTGSYEDDAYEVVETMDKVWVECHKCHKWRSLPQGTDVEALPEEWDCSMNVDDPLRMTCAAEEESEVEPPPAPPLLRCCSLRPKEQQKRLVPSSQ